MFIATTLVIIPSTAVTQTVTINTTNTIIDTARLLATTGGNNEINSTAILPTTTLTFSVSGDSSTGFVYDLSSTSAIEIIKTQNTEILYTSILSTNIESNSVIVVNPTVVPSETNSISATKIGAIIGITLVICSVLISGFVKCFVKIKERRTGNYQINQLQTPEIGEYMDSY